MKQSVIISSLAGLVLLGSCNLTLDLYPLTDFNEGNIGHVDQTTESQYNTREDMLGMLKAMYSKNDACLASGWLQEEIILDGLIYSECRADNAYAGNPNSAEIIALEGNRQDGETWTVVRDWQYVQEMVAIPNQIIFNIDRVFEADSTWTDAAERDNWKAQALSWRAYLLMWMSNLWGDIPVNNSLPPAITSENIEEVYWEYYPERMPKEDVYKLLVDDLTFATEHCPDVDPSNKMLFTKAFAHGMLARIYAEKPLRDWDKVIEHCEAVEGMGFSLCPDYGTMWAYDNLDAVRHTQESIFEVAYTRADGHWLWMMFHRNAWDPNSSYSWLKWCTPSRNLINSYEPGDKRKDVSIIFDQTGDSPETGWSNYYPADSYAFMHKVPTSASSIILMRLGEIYTLHAEALCMKGDFENSTKYLNKTRNRAGLPNLKQPTTQEAMLDAVLTERRFELAFEGFRYWDLVRHDKIIDVFNNVKATEGDTGNYKGWEDRVPLTEETILMPIPTIAIDNNPSLTQNPGY